MYLSTGVRSNRPHLNITGKRANFTSIQLSHHVPCAQGEVNRIRTGTESLIAHMSSSHFAAPAPFDGTVTSVDTKLKLIEVTPKTMIVPTVGDLKLGPDKDIDDAAPRHTYYRVYLEAGIAKVNQIYKLTTNSVGLVSNIAHIATEDIPEAIRNDPKHKGKELRLYTFVLSPKEVTPKKTVFQYGERYTSSQGTYLRQDLVVNVREGDKVKKGDILVYNSGFFVPKSDPFGPGTDLGVDWKHGVMANIYLLETSSTYEDACAITQEFGDKMMMHPAHIRSISLHANTIIHECASVGDHLYSTDPIMVTEDGDLELLGGVDDPDSIEFLNSLSRQKIKAKYGGRVAEINFLYGCPLDQLHPTLRKLVHAQEKRAYTVGKKLGKTDDELNAVYGYLKPGTKYKGTEFNETTVLIEFTIVEDLTTGEGDKLCIMTSNKTVVSKVMEKAPVTESGKKIDIVFSVTSPYKRIVNSPFINGIGNQILEDAEKQIVDLYES